MESFFIAETLKYLYLVICFYLFIGLFQTYWKDRFKPVWNVFFRSLIQRTIWTRREKPIMYLQRRATSFQYATILGQKKESKKLSCEKNFVRKLKQRKAHVCWVNHKIAIWSCDLIYRWIWSSMIEYLIWLGCMITLRSYLIEARPELECTYYIRLFI